MNSGDRLKAIFFIWAAFAVATTVTFFGNSPDVITLFLGLIYGAAAAGSTVAVMLAPMEGISAAQMAQASKQKRGNVERLLNSLNEDELDHLRERLSVDDGDGEMVSLDHLMRERRERR